MLQLEKGAPEPDIRAGYKKLAQQVGSASYTATTGLTVCSA